MKPKRFVTMVFLSAAIISVGLVLAGAAGPESTDSNVTDSPTLTSVSADREEWNVLEGQFGSVAECQEAVLCELVGATEEQWRQIGPKLRELEAVRSRTYSSLGVFAGGGTASGGSAGGGYGGAPSSGRNEGGTRRIPRSDRNVRYPQSVRPSTGVSPSLSGWLRPSQRRAGGQITEGERLCEELLDLIDRADATSEQIRAKMAQLAAHRRKAEEEIKQAQQALRQVVNRRQEAMLILMGYLD